MEDKRYEESQESRFGKSYFEGIFKSDFLKRVRIEFYDSRIDFSSSSPRLRDVRVIPSDSIENRLRSTFRDDGTIFVDSNQSEEEMRMEALTGLLVSAHYYDLSFRNFDSKREFTAEIEEKINADSEEILSNPEEYTYIFEAVDSLVSGADFTRRRYLSNNGSSRTH